MGSNTVNDEAIMGFRSRRAAVVAFAECVVLAQHVWGQPISALAPSPLSAGSVVLLQLQVEGPDARAHANADVLLVNRE
jgi:hypothetical protein